MSRPFDPLTIPLRGIQLVEASAGTGKTYSIAWMFIRLLLEHRLRVNDLLVVTFTEAATAELKNSIRERLQEAMEILAHPSGDWDDTGPYRFLLERPDPFADLERLRQATFEFDLAAVMTIHAFCHKVLKEGAFESAMPFDLDLVSSVEEEVKRFLADQLSTLSGRTDPRLLDAFWAVARLDELTTLMINLLGKRTFPIERASLEEDPESLLAQADRAYEAARAIWRSEHHQILAELNQANFRKAFRETLDARLLPAMERLFQAEAPEWFPHLEEGKKLFPSVFSDRNNEVLKKKAVDNGEIPGHRFFAAWEAFLAPWICAAEIFVRSTLRELGHRCRQEIPATLLRKGMLSFDELLYTLAGRIGDRPAAVGTGRASSFARLIAERYPAAFIDEFQDTDPVQYLIFRKVYGPWRTDKALLLIGDPKQSIYSFRGADLFTYIEAAQAADEIHTMGVNYRSDRRLVLAVNRLFQSAANPFGREEVAFRPVTPRPDAPDLWQGLRVPEAPLQFLALPPDHSLATGQKGRVAHQDLERIIPGLLAADILGLVQGNATLGGKPIRFQDIAILVRTNLQASQVARALAAAGIPAVLTAKESVFASEEAVSLYRLLYALLNPHDLPARKGALAGELFGLRAQDFFDHGGESERYENLSDRFAAWRNTWERHGFFRMIQQLMEECGVAERLLSSPLGERKLTNLRHVSELLHQEEHHRRLSPASLFSWFEEQVASGGRAPREAEELRLETDEAAVVVTTVHRSKGLQFPVVYCPFFWKGAGGMGGKPPLAVAVHDQTPPHQGRWVLLPDREMLARSKEEERLEEMRLFYVAVTRAKHACFLVWAGATAYHSSPLGRLLHSDGIESFSHAELYQELEKRVKEEPDWAVRLLEEPKGEGLVWHQMQKKERLSCRTLERPIPPSRRISSFSGMIMNAPFAEATDEGMDIEPVDLGPGEKEGDEERVLLHAFPAGVRAGNFFHAVLEQLDFSDTSNWQELIHRELAGHGFPPSAWGAQVHEALQRLVATELLPVKGLRLDRIDSCLRAGEMGFWLPVARRGLSLLDSKALASCLAKDPLLGKTYAGEVQRLGFQPLTGFLKGFMDLVFCFDGRYYLVDYKSNLLGETYGAYARDNLAPAMAAHHYHLQYALYTTALHLHLSRSLPGYEYGRHLGGVFYLFLRGMDPHHPGSGIFFHRPEQAMIESLSEVLR